MLDAEASRGLGREALVVDGATTGLASAVRAAVEPAQSPVDIIELHLDLFEDGKLLLALERIAGGIGGMLGEVGELGGTVLLGLVVQVLVLDRLPDPVEPIALGPEVTAGGIRVHGGES